MNGRRSSRDGSLTHGGADGDAGFAWVDRWFLLLVIGASACAPAMVAKSADPIRAGKEAPPAGATPLQTLTAVDGEGCGIGATRGSYEGAIEKLRVRAKAAGANYVQITSVKEPYAERQCTHATYTVVGTAYRIAAGTPPAVPSSFPPVPHALPQSLSFSARISGGGGFTVGLDAPATASTTAPGSSPAGFELKYDRPARRLVLLRQPGATAVSVAPEPFELDADWHEWQVVRGADQISISVDGKAVLTYVAPATHPPSFRLVAESLELRNLSVTTAN